MVVFLVSQATEENFGNFLTLVCSKGVSLFKEYKKRVKSFSFSTIQIKDPFLNALFSLHYRHLPLNLLLA